VPSRRSTGCSEEYPALSVVAMAAMVVVECMGEVDTREDYQGMAW
jgi:hypothetical protein